MNRSSWKSLGAGRIGLCQLGWEEKGSRVMLIEVYSGKRSR